MYTLKDRQRREMVKQSKSINGAFQVTGHSIGVLDAGARREIYDGEKGAMRRHSDEEELKRRTAAARPPIVIKDILEEVVFSEVTPTTATKQPETPTRNNATVTSEYNPEAPQLALPVLLQRIAQNERVRIERSATQPYEHNPYYLYHVFGNAPYTVHLCKRCTRRRKCALHREVFQQQTSISLCSHIRMNLYWAVNDPVNARCSWNLQIKEYFGERRDGCWSRSGDEMDRLEHKSCSVQRGGERARELAVRVVEDMKREKNRRGEKLLRTNVRRVADEIGALLGAWERSVEATERRMREEQSWERARKKADEQLAKTLELVEEMKKMQEVKNAEVVKEVESVQSVEEEHSSMQAPASLPTQSTPPHSATSSSTPELTPTNAGQVEIVQSAEKVTITQASGTPPLQSPPPTSSSRSPSPGPVVINVEQHEEAVSNIEYETNPVQTLHSPPAQPTSPTSTSAPPISPQHTIPQPASPSPSPVSPTKPLSPTSSSCATPRSSSPSPSASPVPSSKRKRSSTPSSSSSSSSPSPIKKPKRVHWTPEIDDLSYTERPRALSQAYVRNAGIYSPDEDEDEEEKEEKEAVRRIFMEGLEDLVDWGEGSEDEEEEEEEKEEEEEEEEGGEFFEDAL